MATAADNQQLISSFHSSLQSDYSWKHRAPFVPETRLSAVMKNMHIIYSCDIFDSWYYKDFGHLNYLNSGWGFKSYHTKRHKLGFLLHFNQSSANFLFVLLRLSFMLIITNFRLKWKQNISKRASVTLETKLERDGWDGHLQRREGGYTGQKVLKMEKRKTSEKTHGCNEA